VVNDKHLNERVIWCCEEWHLTTIPPMSLHSLPLCLGISKPLDTGIVHNVSSRLFVFISLTVRNVHSVCVKFEEHIYFRNTQHCAIKLLIVFLIMDVTIRFFVQIKFCIPTVELNLNLD